MSKFVAARMPAARSGSTERTQRRWWRRGVAVLAASAAALGLPVIGGALPPAAAATEWVATPLKGLGGGIAYGIDGNTIVGVASDKAFAYDLESCSLYDLSALGAGSSAYGVAGTTVVGYYTGSGGYARAFAYDLGTDGPVKDLGTLEEGRTATAYGVSGNRVVGEALTGVGYQRPFVYTLPGGPMTDVGTTSAGHALAKAVSGTVVVGSEPNTQAFAKDLATGTTYHLGVLPGATGAISQAEAVDGSTVVGWSTAPGNVTHAFSYTLPDGPVKDLGTLGGATAEAHGVSGDLTVGWAMTAANEVHAFVYDLSTDGPMADLGTGSAYAIDGQRIVGTDVQGAVIWTPRGQEPTCTSPTQVALSFSGGGQEGSSLSVPAGTAVTAKATLTGPEIASATGTLTYTSHTDSACSSAGTSAGTKTVVNGSAPPSDPLTLPAGAYFWKAAYSGDAAHQASTVCSSKLTVTETQAPTVVSVSSTEPDGVYGVGASIPIQIRFSEPVVVSGGTPVLTLETGATDALVTYVSGSGTDTLTFTYVVAAGQNAADLDYAGTAALALGGATVKDTAGNAAVLTLPIPGGAGSLGAAKAIVIDTTAPNTAITSGPSGATTDVTPTFGFSSDEAGSSFQCRIDTGAWSVCTSPHTTATLAVGAHTFEVRAVDAAGNVDATPASRSFTVDTAAPNTAITSGPSGATTDVTPTFGFSSDEAGSSFQCRIDTGAWSVCTSPHTTATLAAGAHTFEVRAVDAAGNVDATPASRSFTVDTAAPNTAITSGPSGATTDVTPTFGFSSDEAGSSFQCRIDTGAWSVCTSPHTTATLAAGAHTFEVRAVDAAGNVDATPASRSFTVTAADTTPPNTTITSGPSGATTDVTPTFGFSSDEAGSSFQCRIDTGAWSVCTSPHTTATLAVGAHTFEVRAVDAAGNVDATPASRSFTVDTAAPNTAITSGPSGATTDVTPTFGFSSDEAGSSFQCRLDGADWVACTSPHTTATLAVGAHTFEVRAVDAAGNVDATPASRSFTVEHPDVPLTLSLAPAACGLEPSASWGLTVGGAEGQTDSLKVTVVSSNPRIVSAAGIVVTGSGQERRFVVKPTGKAGSAQLTVTVTAGGRAVSQELQVVVGTRARDVLSLTGQGMVFGLSGHDELWGSGAGDLLCGGAGADVVRAGGGDDVVFGGVGADHLLGDAGDDALHGGRGADRIFGGVGDDQLFGDRGNDRLAGGPGADLFKGGPDRDVLVDFNVKEGDRR